MSVDLTKLILYSGANTFKNNKIYTGSKTITGNHSPGVTTKTFDVALDQAPDLLQVTFKAPADPIGVDERPADCFFDYGLVYEQIADGGGGFPAWSLGYTINGTILTIRAQYMQTYSGTYASDPTTFQYRIVDYSVF